VDQPPLVVLLEVPEVPCETIVSIPVESRAAVRGLLAVTSSRNAEVFHTRPKNIGPNAGSADVSHASWDYGATCAGRAIPGSEDAFIAMHTFKRPLQGIHGLKLRWRGLTESH